MTLHVTDHAVLRYLERVRGIDIERLRADLQRKATRAHASAVSIGGGEFTIIVDGFRMKCQNDHVVTVLEAR